MNGPFRGGMQVHAVPEDERAFDETTGIKLPWGYSYADASMNKSTARTPRESGPFGKPIVRRSYSRASRHSRTITPAGPGADPDRAGMQKEQDAVFGQWKNKMDVGPPRRGTSTHTHHPETVEQPLQRQSSRELKHTSGSPPDQAASAAEAAADEPPAFTEPTEVLLYGFLPSSQAAAIAFFETASRGLIYEDYDRAASNPRFGQSAVLAQTNFRLAAAAHAEGHAVGTAGLTQTALRNINEYRGGEHWIKVTFDSPSAAERAVGASPHLVGGCLVHAELWRGQGPREDEAIPAQKEARTAGTLGREGQQRPQRRRNDFASLPARAPAGAFPFNPNDSTSSTETAGASSNTINGSSNTLDASTSSATLAGEQSHQPNGEMRQRHPAPEPAPSLRKPKIRGARTVALQPKEQALLPLVPWRTQLLSAIPIVGALVVGTTGGGGATQTVSPQEEVKGLPRREDGSVDWRRTGWTWWVLGWLDWVVGTDICGLKED